MQPGLFVALFLAVPIMAGNGGIGGLAAVGVPRFAVGIVGGLFDDRARRIREQLCRPEVVANVILHVEFRVAEFQRGGIVERKEDRLTRLDKAGEVGQEAVFSAEAGAPFLRVRIVGPGELDGIGQGCFGAQ
jgi:hypothetical protein